ncbi:MAG: hypothetical protein GX257_04860 [Clostridiales bacterium]|jgi:hypothetical protein|nr:hypothetical protein [Clostridiales bacterium]
MAEFDNKIRDLLSSPDGVEKIVSAIRELSGGQSAQPAEQEETSLQMQAPPSMPAPVQQMPVSSVPDLSAISNIDPRVMNTAMRVLQDYSRNDDKIALLNALKPHLRSERRQRIDKASQALRLAKSVKTALNSLSGGDTLV